MLIAKRQAEVDLAAAQQGVAADELVGRPSAALWRSQLNAGTLARRERDVVREQLLIEGYLPSELPEALGPELEAEVTNGRPLVARVGTAEVLISLVLDGGVLRAELAHVDGGGEGVLPALISVILRFARRQSAAEIEWLVFATNCARPNPRLRPILEGRGFVVREVPDRGFCYYRRDRVVSSDESKTEADAG